MAHRNAGSGNPNWQGGKIKLNCINCNNIFYANKGRLLRGHARFCSKSCANSGENNPRYGKKASIKFKEIMGKRMGGKNNPMFGKVPVRLLGKENPMFGRVLDRNPNWRGGKSFEPYPIKWNNELRESIRKRDNYECARCGINQNKLSRRLHVHHKDCNKENLQNDNLISLCVNCHSKEHNEIRRRLLESLV